MTNELTQQVMAKAWTENGKWLPWPVCLVRCCQFTLGVTEEQQDMIPPTTKSLRQRRCGHCLLQVSCPPCQHAATGHVEHFYSTIREKKKGGMISQAKECQCLPMDLSPHVLYICVSYEFELQFFLCGRFLGLISYFEQAECVWVWEHWLQSYVCDNIIYYICILSQLSQCTVSVITVKGPIHPKMKM